MTIDVEDYFQVAAFEDVVDRQTWESRPHRVCDSTNSCLDLFAEAGVRATFFILGWVAERYPLLVRRIVADGHEIASHGYDHKRVTDLSPTEFRADVRRTKALLQEVSGHVVIGYRAPSYSIGRDNLWALDVLQDEGYEYSSSVYPIRHDHYGMPEAPRFAFRVRQGALLELPITTCSIGGINLPCGGGGYFRLLPYNAFSWALRRVNRRDMQPGIFYFHPWELDPAQPRIAQAARRSRFRHYTNLHAMEGRMRRLLREFRWSRMDEVFSLRPASGA